MSKTNNLTRQESTSVLKENILQRSKSKDKSNNPLKLSQVLNSVLKESQDNVPKKNLNVRSKVKDYIESNKTYASDQENIVEKFEYKQGKENTSTSKNKVKSQIFHKNNNLNNKIKSDFQKLNTFNNNFSKHNAWEKKPNSIGKEFTKSLNLTANQSKQNYINNIQSISKTILNEKETDNKTPNNIISEPSIENKDTKDKNKYVEAMNEQEEDKEFLSLMQDELELVSNNPQDTKNQTKIKLNEEGKESKKSKINENNNVDQELNQIDLISKEKSKKKAESLVKSEKQLSKKNLNNNNNNDNKEQDPFEEIFENEEIDSIWSMINNDAEFFKSSKKKKNEESTAVAIKNGNAKANQATQNEFLDSTTKAAILQVIEEISERKEMESTNKASEVVRLNSSFNKSLKNFNSNNNNRENSSNNNNNNNSNLNFNNNSNQGKSNKQLNVKNNNMTTNNNTDPYKKNTNSNNNFPSNFQQNKNPNQNNSNNLNQKSNQNINMNNKKNPMNNQANRNIKFENNQNEAQINKNSSNVNLQNSKDTINVVNVNPLSSINNTNKIPNNYNLRANNQGTENNIRNTSLGNRILPEEMTNTASIIKNDINLNNFSNNISSHKQNQDKDTIENNQSIDFFNTENDLKKNKADSNKMDICDKQAENQIPQNCSHPHLFHNRQNVSFNEDRNNCNNKIPSLHHHPIPCCPDPYRTFCNPYICYPPSFNPFSYPYPPNYNPYMNSHYNPFLYNHPMPMNNQIFNPYPNNNPFNYRYGNKYYNNPEVSYSTNPYVNMNNEYSKISNSKINYKLFEEKILETFKIFNCINKEKEVSENDMQSNKNFNRNTERQKETDATNPETALEHLVLNSLLQSKANLTRENLLPNIIRNVGIDENKLLNVLRCLDKKEDFVIENKTHRNNNNKLNDFGEADKSEANKLHNHPTFIKNVNSHDNTNTNFKKCIDEKSNNNCFQFQKENRVSNENNFKNINETLNFNLQSEKNKLFNMNNENTGSNLTNFEDIFDINNPIDLKTIEDKEFDRILNQMEKKPNKQNTNNNTNNANTVNFRPNPVSMDNRRKPFQPPKANKSFKMDDFDEKADKINIKELEDNEFDSFLKNIKNSDFKNLNDINGNFGFKKANNFGEDNPKNDNNNHNTIKDRGGNNNEMRVLSDFMSFKGNDKIKYKINPRLKKLQEEMERDVFLYDLDEERDKANKINNDLGKANNNNKMQNQNNEKAFSNVNNSFTNNPIKRIHSDISNIILTNTNKSLDSKAMEEQHFDKKIQKLEKGIKIIKNNFNNKAPNNTSDTEFNEKNNPYFIHNNKKNSLIKIATNSNNTNNHLQKKNNSNNNVFSLIEKNAEKNNKNNHSFKEEYNKTSLLQGDHKHQVLSNRSVDNLNENWAFEKKTTQDNQNDFALNKIDNKSLFEYQDFSNKNVDLECISDCKIYCKECFGSSEANLKNSNFGVTCDNCFDFKFICQENIKQIFSEYYKKMKLEEIKCKSQSLFELNKQAENNTTNTSFSVPRGNQVLNDSLSANNSQTLFQKQKSAEFEQSELNKLNKSLEKISTWESEWFLLQFSYITYKLFILNQIFNNKPTNKIDSATKSGDSHNNNNNKHLNQIINDTSNNVYSNENEIPENNCSIEFNFQNILTKLYKNFNHVYESGLRSFLTKLYDKDYTLNQAIVLLIFKSTATDKDTVLLELTDSHRLVYSRIHSSNPVFSLIKNGILKRGIKLKIATSKIESTDEAKIFISLFYNSISVAPITEKLGLAAQPLLLKNLVNIREDGGPVSKVDVILLKKFSYFVYNKTQNKRKNFNKYAKEREAAAENAVLMAQSATAEDSYVDRDFDYDDSEQNYYSDALLIKKGEDKVKDHKGNMREIRSKAALGGNFKDNKKEVYSDAAVGKNNGYNALQHKKAQQIKKTNLKNDASFNKSNNFNNSFANQSFLEADEISICFKIICVDTTAYYSLLNKTDYESSLKLYNFTESPICDQKPCNSGSPDLQQAFEDPDDLTIDEFNEKIHSVKFQNKLVKLCLIEISAKSADIFEELEEGKRYFLSNFNKSNLNSAYGARKNLLRLKAYQDLLIEEASPKLNLINPNHKETLKNLLDFLKYDKNETEISEALQRNKYIYADFQEKEFYCVGLLQDYFVDGKDAFLVLRSVNKNLVLVKIHDFDFFDLSAYANLVNNKNKKVVSVKNVVFQIIHYLENSVKTSLEGKNVTSDAISEKIIIYVETSNYSEFKSEDALLPKFNLMMKENQELVDSEYLKELRSFVTGKKSLSDS